MKRQSNKFQNILIIKPSALGDIVLALPALVSLRASFANAKISWFVRSEFAPLLENVSGDVFSKKILYIQADHFQVGSSSLYEIAETFASYGGKWIVFDEIHKYPKWSKELKSIYDTFEELEIIASGSSALEASSFQPG